MPYMVKFNIFVSFGPMGAFLVGVPLFFYLFLGVRVGEKCPKIG